MASTTQMTVQPERTGPSRLLICMQVCLFLLMSTLIAVWGVRHETLRGSHYLAAMPFSFSATITFSALGMLVTALSICSRFFVEPDRTGPMTMRLSACIFAAVAGTLAFTATPYTHWCYWQSRFIPWLVPLVVFLFSLSILLPDLSNGIARSRYTRLLLQQRWVRLCVVSCILLAAVESHVLYFLNGSSSHTSVGAYGLNVLLFLSLVLIALALTRRYAFSVGLATFFFLALSICNYYKCCYMNSPISPLDVYYLRELRPIFLGLLGTPVTLAAVSAILFAIWTLMVLWRRADCSWTAWKRFGVGTMVAGVLAVFTGPWSPSIMPLFIGTWGIRPSVWDPIKGLSQNGLLLELALTLPKLYVDKPTGYSLVTVERISRKYQSPEAMTSIASSPSTPKIIVLLVESLMDPADLGLQFAKDPIPNLRALMRESNSGYCLSPSIGGNSANSEFELLTGLSMEFVPRGSCPFNQYIKHDIPALPRWLRSQGYQTTAIIGTAPGIYNLGEVLPRLGFDSTRWLLDVPGVKTTRDVYRRVLDECYMDAILDAHRVDGRQFIYAFTVASHNPYQKNLHAVDGRATIEVADALSPHARGELADYVESLRTVDAQIGRLVAELRESDEETLLIITGDHLPPFSEPDGVYSFAGFLGDGPEVALRRHRVPLVVWKNRTMTTKDVSCSMNFVPDLLLEHANLRGTGYFALFHSFRRHLRFLHQFAPDADTTPSGEPREAFQRGEVISDYRLIAYDALFGDQYLGKHQQVVRSVSD